jgi:hypothetical protein
MLMFLTHGYDLRSLKWSTVASIKNAIKKSKSEIFTPKFKSIGSIWAVLVGPCKKSQNY